MNLLYSYMVIAVDVQRKDEGGHEWEVEKSNKHLCFQWLRTKMMTT